MAKRVLMDVSDLHSSTDMLYARVISDESLVTLLRMNSLSGNKQLSTRLNCSPATVVLLYLRDRRTVRKEDVSSVCVGYEKDGIMTRVSGTDTKYLGGIEVIGASVSVSDIIMQNAKLAVDLTTAYGSEGERNFVVMKQDSVKIPSFRVKTEEHLALLTKAVEKVKGDTVTIAMSICEDKTNSIILPLINSVAPASLKVAQVKRGNCLYIGASGYTFTNYPKESLTSMVTMLHGSTHPKGAYADLCARHVHGVQMPYLADRYIHALIDHPVPHDVDEVHLYTSDSSYGIIFANRYPKKRVYILGDCDLDISKKLPFGSYRVDSLIAKGKNKGVMRIGLFDKGLTDPGKNSSLSIYDLGLQMDAVEDKLDSFYSCYSRYISIFAIHGRKRLQLCSKLSKGFATVTSYDGYDFNVMYNFYLNARIHYFAFPWIFTSLMQIAEFANMPRIYGLFDLRRSADVDAAIKQFTDMGITTSGDDFSYADASVDFSCYQPNTSRTSVAKHDYVKSLTASIQSVAPSVVVNGLITSGNLSDSLVSARGSTNNARTQYSNGDVNNNNNNNNNDNRGFTFVVDDEDEEKDEECYPEVVTSSTPMTDDEKARQDTLNLFSNFG